jgi:hypothetical protein
MGEERRKMPRYPFSAFAELVIGESGTRINSQVRELSLHGCYLEMTDPLPPGTSFLIKIFYGTEFFESSATVLYSLPNQGMGVLFHDIRSSFVSVLRKWLLKAMLKR